MAASGGRRKCALCLVTFVSFLVMTLLLSAMSSSKEDLRESLSKISTQDIGETALQAMEFFTHSFNVFDDDDEEEEEKEEESALDVAEERDYLLGNKHSFANGFEVADADVIIAAASPTEYRPKVPKAASSGGKNEICAKAYLDRLPCTITKKMPECVGDSFNFGNHYWTVSQKAVEKYKTDRNLNSISKATGVKKRLPKDGPFDERNVKPYRSCAIVASSKALRGKKFGAKIDNHEVVMRMNGAPTKGYEKDVGFKTTFRVQHGGYFGWREKPEEVCLGKWAAGRDRGSHSELEKMARTKVHAINPNFARKSRTDWFTKRDHLPTQGFRALLILLASCKEVSAFGFSGGAGWYFDKVKNRGPADKRKHGQGLAKNRWLDAPKPAADRGSNSKKKRRLLSLFSNSEREGEEEVEKNDEKFNITLPKRSLLATHPRNTLPTTHKLSVERECIRNLIKLKFLQKGG